MEKERLALLKAEIYARVKEIDSIYAKVDDRKGRRGRIATESLAYQLHNLYCAFEDLFKVIADFFENNIEDKTRYHAELLKRMLLTIEGVRPALLSEENFVLLNNLRSFRHFFRHAYSYELDERKVRLVLADATKLRELYIADVEVFLKGYTS